MNNHFYLLFYVVSSFAQISPNINDSYLAVKTNDRTMVHHPRGALCSCFPPSAEHFCQKIHKPRLYCNNSCGEIPAALDTGAVGFEADLEQNVYAEVRQAAEHEYMMCHIDTATVAVVFGCSRL